MLEGRNHSDTEAMSDFQEQEDTAPEVMEKLDNLLEEVVAPKKNKRGSKTPKGNGKGVLYEQRLAAKAKREAAGLPWKPTEADIAMRVQDVQAKLRHGYTGREIIDYLMEKYLISENAAYDLLKKARQSLVRLWDEVAREELAAELMDRCDHAIKVGMENRQVGAAIGAIQAQARMVGIDTPTTKKKVG